MSDKIILKIFLLVVDKVGQITTFKTEFTGKPDYTLLRMNDKPVAVITGASRGIGRSVAIALAAEGYDIAAIARSVDSEGMEILGPEVEKRGAQFFPIGLDISCTGCQKEVVSNILERYGRIDFLVNNAGVAPLQRNDVLDMTEESYDRVMNINLKGPVFFAQKIARGNDLA